MLHMSWKVKKSKGSRRVASGMGSMGGGGSLGHKNWKSGGATLQKS